MQTVPDTRVQAYSMCCVIERGCLALSSAAKFCQDACVSGRQSKIGGGQDSEG